MCWEECYGKIKTGEKEGRDVLGRNKGEENGKKGEREEGDWKGRGRIVR